MKAIILFTLIICGHLSSRADNNADTLIKIRTIQPEPYHYETSRYCDLNQLPVFDDLLEYLYGNIIEPTGIGFSTDINDVAWLRAGAYHQRRGSLIFMEKAEANGNVHLLDGMYVLQR